MKKTLLLLTLISTFILASEPLGGWRAAQIDKDKDTLSVEEFKNKYRDNYKELTKEDLLKNYGENVNLEITPDFDIAQMVQNRDTDKLLSLFTCPQLKNEDIARLYDADYHNGTFKCLYFADNGFTPVGYFTMQIKNWNDAIGLDLKRAENVSSGLVAEARARAEAFQQAQTNDNMSGYLNNTDLILASILTNGEIIDTEATRASGKIVLNENYQSLHLSNTTTVLQSSSQTSWSQVSGFMDTAKYLFTATTGVDTDVKVQKKLEAMELKINDQTNLLANTNANIFEMIHTFSEISAVYYFGLASVALMLGLILWGYDGLENNNGKTTLGKLKKGYPIAIVGSLLFLLPYNENYQSKYQEIELSGYSMANSFANDLAEGFIETEFKSIQNQLGIYAADQIIQSVARLAQQSQLTWLYASMVNRCQREKIHETNKFFENRFAEKNNLFFSTQENIVNALHLNVDVYNSNNIENHSLQNPTSTVSFCAKSYEKYYIATANYDKFQSVVDGKTMLNSDQMAKLLKLQYSLFTDMGWPAVLATPIIKYRLENAGLITDKPQESENSDDLIQTFANQAVLYLLPGSEKIAGLASTLLSPLEKIPYIGTLIAKGGGVVISTLFMSKILSILPVVSILLFGSFRLVIILIKIFVFHLFTPFLMIAVLMNKASKEAVFKYSSYVFATMLEMPIFVFGIYTLIVMQSYLNGVGSAMTSALNTIYLESGSAVDEWEMLSNLDYYALGAVADVSLKILALVMIWKVIFSIHNMVLNAIQTQSENTLEGIAETALQSGRHWHSKI